MRTRLLFYLLSTMTWQFMSAQPTQAELDKMMKDAQELSRKLKNEPAVQKAIKSQGANNSGSPQYASDPGAYGNADNWTFPTKNMALLSALPKKTLNKAELALFLQETYALIAKKFKPEINSSVQAISTQMKNDGNSMGDAAVAGWYSDHPEESLLLILKAAFLLPENELLLNNCAALLTMSGNEHRSIPVLKYLLHSNPESSTVLNNLGQAYAGLGETDTAMVYFMRCMRSDPGHPQACGTAGQIEATKGNTEKAVEYLEKSLQSAYTKTAELKLRKLKKGSRISRLVRPRVKLPEYFNMFKYRLPAQCTRIEDAIMADAEHTAFRNMIMQQAQSFGAIYQVLAQQQYQKTMQMMNTGAAGRKLREDEFMAQPFYELCTIMAGDVLSEFTDDLKVLGAWVKKQFTPGYEILEREYDTRLKTLNKIIFDTEEERCKEVNALSNEFLPRFAVLMKELQERHVRVYQQYFDELVYWHFLSLNPMDKEKSRMTQIGFIEKYLVMIGGVCQTKIIKPCDFTPISLTKEANTIPGMECPIDVELAIGVAKIALNCDRFSLEGGEGVVFSYEKNFRSRQSTLTVGIGVKIDLGIKVGTLKAGIGARATESLFITFDGNNHIADAGWQNEARLTGKVTGLGKESIGVGSKFSINNGWDFNEGPFKAAPEQPLNKNVKVYKPG